MLDADVYALFDVSVSDDFVHDDTDCVGGDVVDYARSSDNILDNNLSKYWTQPTRGSTCGACPFAGRRWP